MVVEETVIDVPPDVVNVTVGVPLASNDVPVTMTEVAPTATFTLDVLVTVGMGLRVATVPDALLTPYIVTTHNTVWDANEELIAGTVTVSCVEDVTLTLDTVMVAPPEVVNVAAGVPPDAKFVPVTTRLVEPTATLTLDVEDTVGMGRMVATPTAEPLDTPYIVTIALRDCPDIADGIAVVVAVT